MEIYLGKYGMSHKDKEDSDEEKILKYAEALYGTYSLNAKQKLDCNFLSL